MAYGDNVVIKNLNFEVEEGQLVTLVGPSGCGKTTILQLINRLINPISGKIYLEGVDIQTMNPVELRKKIGYVIQEIGLFPHMTIEQNIEIVPKLLGWPSEKRKNRTIELLEMVGMDPDTYLNRYPADLSGGQQQRVGVLRALAAEPPLILMDEPFGALDPIIRENLQDEIKKLQKNLKKTIIFVTHDMDEAIKIADIIVIIKDGEIVQSASPDELLSNPRNKFVEQFIGKHRIYESQIDKVKDIMRKNVFKVSVNMGLERSISLMEKRGVSTLIVVDDKNRLLGFLGIEDIMKQVQPGLKVSDLKLDKMPTIGPEEPAKKAFDLFDEQNLDILTVVDEGSHILGIVTKTSMVKSLAHVVWKEDSNE
ncbi:ABC transporter ATP-binding protein [Miniphocaeibacter halophilus]|uniref:ABC transporter ATP-binding protein n=2 Tax=Miniphocaeibacter halophilus TaxID=2931922 RepID=A0AC61N0A1_9FIRM|nr:ABC transporter ATP-binding protein [Miniphocaeibacter halophilus]